MFKKLIFIIFLLLFSFNYKVFWFNSNLVQDVFLDIDSNYKYLQELQVFYDKWMILPDNEWKFNPKELLNRDEFVWILSEISCKKCIQPFVDIDLIDKYKETKIFYDIYKKNKYFYCISYSYEKWYVKWYHKSTTCDDWTYIENEAPFCPNNNIILEEALSIIMRASWILTNSQADKVRQAIIDWTVTKDLSEDVSPKNLDWSVYSFYPDFQKAIDYEIMDVDLNWNIKYYKLVEIIDWKLRPKKSISKEEFLRLAYVALRANSCLEKQNNVLPINIIIKDKSCAQDNLDCDKTEISSTEDTYDFLWEVWKICEEWINDETWYNWRFYNLALWEEIFLQWKYIDNYKIPSNWNWEVFLIVEDNCWNIWEANVSMYINKDKNSENNQGLSVLINVSKQSWKSPLNVNFKSIVSWWEAPYYYNWDFWDGNKSNQKNEINIFKLDWIYKVKLDVIDYNNKKWSAYLYINVNSFNNLLGDQKNQWNQNNTDTDNDWIFDIEDLCPTVYWSEDNNWCPIYEIPCENSDDCINWTYCSEKNICVLFDVSNNCNYTWWDLIFWNVICNTCPCDYLLDFKSILRRCDVVFPAIVSPDNSEIYWKWIYYEIQ